MEFDFGASDGSLTTLPWPAGEGATGTTGLTLGAPFEDLPPPVVVVNPAVPNVWDKIIFCLAMVGKSNKIWANIFLTNFI